MSSRSQKDLGPNGKRRPPRKARTMASTYKPTPSESEIAKAKASIRSIFDAVYANDVNKLRQLVKGRKLAVNIVDDEDPLRPTPLLIACELQHPEIVEVLLKVKPKADVNKGNKKGRRPIWWAAKHGNEEIADMLIFDGKDDCDVKCIDEESGCTPLYRAILSSAPEVCRKLIHAGADVNLRRLWKSSGESEVAESPLVKSVQLGNFKVCEVLVNSLCDINAKTEDGFTALHYAVGYRRYEIAEFLLENCIRVNVRSRRGVTAMTVAIREHLPAMCKILIEWGYDMDKKFKWDETPLEMAIRLHAEKCAMTLVAWGCKIVPDRKYRFMRKDKVPPSMFYRAAKEGHVELLKLMIEMHPYFLYEEWVRTQQIPLALYHYPDFCEWLFGESQQTRSLQVLCRASILQYMGKYGCKRIEKLPLPSELQNFLRMDHFFNDKVYRRVPLEAHTCPFRCPVLCERRPQCPELDFTDSCSD